MRKLKKHEVQWSAKNDISVHLLRALRDIHRATDGDGVPTNIIGDHIEAIDMTEADAKEAIASIDWFLYDKDGKAWAEHCGSLKGAFRAILREAKRRIKEVDWTPCNCQYCRKHRATRNKK